MSLWHAWCNRCANDIEGVFQQSPFTVTGRFKYQTALAGAPHYSTHWKERWHDHIQGFVRLPESTGKPLFVYTRSRPRDPFRCFLDEWSVPIDQCRSETGFFLVEVDGVDEQGNQGHAMQSGTQRSDRDRFSHRSHGGVRHFVRVDDTDHPGGIQSVGQTLAVAALCKETPACAGRTFVDLYDLSNWHQSGVWHIQRVETPDVRASAVAITRLHSGRYLMFVMGSDMKDGQWFMSDRPVLHPDTQWTLVGEFKATRDVIADADDFLRYCEEITGHSLWQDLGCALVQQNRSLNLSSDWSVRWTQPQNAAFVTSCETGNLYMITSGNLAYRPKGDRRNPNTWHETADLYQVSQRDGHFKLELIAKRRVRAVDAGSCTLRAAGSVHVTPAGELLFYCNTHHPDDGGDGPMKFEEYHLNNLTGLR